MWDRVHQSATKLVGPMYVGPLVGESLPAADMYLHSEELAAIAGSTGGLDVIAHIHIALPAAHGRRRVRTFADCA